MAAADGIRGCCHDHREGWLSMAPRLARPSLRHPNGRGCRVRRSTRPMAPLTAAAAILAITVIAGCAFAGETQSPIPTDEPINPGAGDTATPPGGDGHAYDGQLLGFG